MRGRGTARRTRHRCCLIRDNEKVLALIGSRPLLGGPSGQPEARMPTQRLRAPGTSGKMWAPSGQWGLKVCVFATVLGRYRFEHPVTSLGGGWLGRLWQNKSAHTARQSKPLCGAAWYPQLLVVLFFVFCPVS